MEKAKLTMKNLPLPAKRLIADSNTNEHIAHSSHGLVVRRRVFEFHSS